MVESGIDVGENGVKREFVLFVSALTFDVMGVFRPFRCNFESRGSASAYVEVFQMFQPSCIYKLLEESATDKVGQVHSCCSGCNAVYVAHRANQMAEATCLRAE